MRESPRSTDPIAGPIILLGTGDAAVAALWRLRAAGAQIRWYADRTDIGEEIAFAAALGGGRLELSFESPPAAPLDGVAARGDDREPIAEREVSGAPRVRDVLARLCARVLRSRHLASAEPEAA